MNELSILESIKSKLGIDIGDTNFDNGELIDFINTVFFDLNEIGVGPEEGFEIDDITMWSDFSQDMTIVNAAKTYVYLKVRMLFDPPDSSFTQASFERQIDKYEWRLLVASERAKEVEDA